METPENLETPQDPSAAPTEPIQASDVQEGQSLVEYGLILGLVVLVCIAALTVFGGGVGTLYNNIAGSMPW